MTSIPSLSLEHETKRENIRCGGRERKRGKGRKGKGREGRERER